MIPLLLIPLVAGDKNITDFNSRGDLSRSIALTFPKPMELLQEGRLVLLG
jgi:hypothetical protein